MNPKPQGKARPPDAPPATFPLGRNATPPGPQTSAAASAVPSAATQPFTRICQYVGLTPTRLLPSRRRAAAFTILEVLVASTIMVIVMFVLVATANTSLQLWRTTTEKLAVDREGRIGLALLSWDLQNIIQPTNIALRPWVNTNTNASSFPALRFLTLKPADYQTNPASDLGDVCYVEYRFTNRSIMRAFVGSSATFAELQAGRLPTPNNSDFETMVPNVYTCKFWGVDSVDSNISYNNNGQQTTDAQTLRGIEYRLGLLDQKFMKLYTGQNGENLALAQKTNGILWYQASQPAPPPAH
jgi:hypothetical protein